MVSTTQRRLKKASLREHSTPLSESTLSNTTRALIIDIYICLSVLLGQNSYNKKKKTVKVLNQGDMKNKKKLLKLFRLILVGCEQMYILVS